MLKIKDAIVKHNNDLIIHFMHS